MKYFLTIMSLLFYTNITCADTIMVGDQALDIPSPEQYSSVTEQMDGVYRLGQSMIDEVNDQLGFYILSSDVPRAMTGEVLTLERYFLLKVNKQLKQVVLGSKDFDEFKTQIKAQNKEVIKSMESKLPGLMAQTSEGFNEQFDVDVAMKISKVVPLDPHFEADNTLAYSMYINLGVTADGQQKDYVIAATATFLNVSGKLLFLYCYATPENLEWSREASRAWADSILASNVAPPLETSGNGINWSKVIDQAIIGGLIGALLGLIGLVWGRFAKKKED